MSGATGMSGAGVQGSASLSNPDLLPVPPERRTWSMWHLASLWVGMSVCIPTYMLAASMIGAGMTWQASLFAILLGNAIVLVPLVINAHAGTRYGIPFPVLARASFGTAGAHVPSLLRSLVACGWFGIQTWIGGLAIHALLSILWPVWPTLGGDWTFLDQTLPLYLSFLAFWLVNMYFVWAGTESIKWMETLAAPFLIAIGLALLWWAAARVGGIGAILRQSDALALAQPEPTRAHFLLGVFLPWLTAMVGYWATLSLNIPDFTRYSRTQRDQALGQAIGLLTTMPLFAFIGVAVTSATVLLYGEAIWNPIDLLARLSAEQATPWLGILALLALLLATLTTNIAANVVAPANSFSNVAPRRIDFRTGGLIAGLIGILILPWKLLDVYQGWLISYSGLLGAVAGVMICDYVVVRRGRLSVSDLYLEGGAYGYTRGVNRRAMVALVAGIAVALLGKVVPGLGFLFSGAWFSATLVAFGVYWLLMRAHVVTAPPVVEPAATAPLAASPTP
ncbi:MAG TPA: NCS1 family nucleobase:cation symporter-1 [Longimicrobiales bacterium]|nr:NCS1 family nucleobase:cation symporter-1 [Longimicrobiales bacterium]